MGEMNLVRVQRLIFVSPECLNRMFLGVSEERSCRWDYHLGRVSDTAHCLNPLNYLLQCRGCLLDVRAVFYALRGSF